MILGTRFHEFFVCETQLGGIFLLKKCYKSRRRWGKCKQCCFELYYFKGFMMEMNKFSLEVTNGKREKNMLRSVLKDLVGDLKSSNVDARCFCAESFIFMCRRAFDSNCELIFEICFQIA